jgi:four helix bundle protein
MAQTTNAEAMKNRTKQLRCWLFACVELFRQARKGGLSRASLLHSATSVAANYRAVCRARSAADFVSKPGIVLEEADETLFWLELLVDAGIVSSERIREALNEANELVSIFVVSLRTAKGLNLQSKI